MRWGRSKCKSCFDSSRGLGRAKIDGRVETDSSDVEGEGEVIERELRTLERRKSKSLTISSVRTRRGWKPQ